MSPPSEPSPNQPVQKNYAYAPKECPRSGQPPKRRKRRATQGRTEEVLGDEQTEQPQKYVGVLTPMAPSPEILSQTMGWLSKMASSHINDLDTWVEEVTKLLNGSEWASQSEALSDNSLLHIAQRCQRAETVSSGANFVKIMAELFFAAKVNGYSFFTYLTLSLSDNCYRILLHHALPQFLEGKYSLKERRRKFRISITSSLNSLGENGIPKSTSFNWYSSGSRWARLAASGRGLLVSVSYRPYFFIGSIYLLIIVASNPGLAAALRSSAVTHSVILSLCNEIRQPQSPSKGSC